MPCPAARSARGATSDREEANCNDRKASAAVGRTEVNPVLPVVIITGRWQQRELAEKAGVGALIEKPLNVPRLLETVKELLAEPPDVHLKRLVGQISDARYVPPPRLSPGTKRRTTKPDSS